MAKSKQSTTDYSKKAVRPALTPEARENQLISLAVDLAEQQLRDGTASSQVITHYLKLGSTKEKIEKEILEKQKKYFATKETYDVGFRILQLKRLKLQIMAYYPKISNPGIPKSLPSSLTITRSLNRSHSRLW